MSATMNKKSLNKITMLNILSTFLIQGISIITAPIISRLLDTANYGIVSIYSTWVSIATILFSLQTQATLNVARTEYPDSEQIKYQSSVMFLSFLAFLVSTVLIVVFIKPLAEMLQLEPLMLILMMIQAYGTYCVAMLNGKWTYEFKADKNMYLAVLTTVLIMALSIWFITQMPKESNYWGRIAALTLVYGICAICITLYFFIKGKSFFQLQYWKFCLPLALPIVLHSISNLILNQSDKMMLQRLCSNSVVGIYSLVVAFSNVMSTIWLALNHSWTPFFYEYSLNKQLDKIKTHGFNFIRLFTVLSMGFMLLAPEVFRLFAAKEYWDGIPLIPLFVLGAYFVFLYGFPVNYEFFNKSTKATAVGTMLAGGCNIVLNLIFIKWWGVTGAALATMIAHSLQFAFHYCFAMQIKKGEDYPFKLKLILPYLIAVVVVGIWVMLFPGSWLIRWGVGALIGIVELREIIKRKSIF